MEETAALLGSTAIKQRLAGVTELLQQLRRPGTSSEDLGALIPHVLPCLRDHNSKITLGALEILELLVAGVAEATLRTHFKPLWNSVVERLGDSKLPVREKAVDVVVEISVVLDASAVLEKLKLCMQHKNWRTREQSLHAVWRCLERHNLFSEKQDELLDDVLKLLEDSSKEVRDAAITALEKFYTYIGPSLLSDLEYKNIRSAHMKTLTDRFERIPAAGKTATRSVTFQASDEAELEGSSASEYVSALPDELSSILSSYDLQVSSSSSMARYLASVRSRTQNEAKAAVAAPMEGERSPSQASSVATASVAPFDSGVSEKEIQKQLGVIFDKLQPDNNWSKRVDGLKMLQKLAIRCSQASNSGTVLPILSQGFRPVRERLCEQVSDLRSSVSREACKTIETLANALHDEFNAHAEICLGNLLKATYVTIQVISTAADTTIRSMIESTSNGYARVIPKLVDCVKSRNQVLRYNAVCYLTLTLQRWSLSFLGKHSEMFAPILPAVLQDAVGDVRAQSRRLYWSYHHLFPSEAKDVFARLDGSTQRNLRDDPARYHASDARKTDWGSPEPPASQNSQAGVPDIPRAPISAPAALSSIPADGNLPTSNSQRMFSAEEAASGKLPRRVLGVSSSSAGAEVTADDAQPSRMLSQGPMRVGLTARPKSAAASSKDGPASTNERKKAATGPLRVRNAPKTAPAPKASAEALFTSRQEPSSASFHTSSQNPPLKAQRVQLAVDTRAAAAMDIDDDEPSGPKRLPVQTMASPTASNASSAKTNNSSSRGRKKEASDAKSKPPRAAPTKAVERPSSSTDQVDAALRSFDSKSWSTRLEAAEYIGRWLQKCVDQADNAMADEIKVSNRVVMTCIKHLSDPHYRVSQEVLKHFLPLLKISNHSQRLVQHLKPILPKLFQKFIDTKESVRALAKENLEYIASAVENSTLAALVISMLGDGSNMKVKAAMCHYLRELLPGADTYMKQGANNSHMRAFLLKIALLMDTDVPVSVSSACGELVSVAAKLYGPEMETALGLLPPSKRAVVSKVFKSRRIILNFNTAQRPPTPPAPAPVSTRSRDEDNQKMEVAAPKPERSRKRPESPSVSSSSPPRQNSQKRINTTSQPAADEQVFIRRPASSPTVERVDEGIRKVALQRRDALSTPLFSRSIDRLGAELEDILHILEQNNSSEADVKSALYKALHFIETESSETWDRCFGRLLLLLLDSATDKDVYALKVLQRLVEAQPSRAQMFFELLLQRLVDAIGDQVDVARHLMERILHDLVRHSSDNQQTLTALVPFIVRTESPALQVVLRLVKLSLESCERGEATFLRKQEAASPLMSALTRRLDHVSSNVRKNAVDCLVALHFALKDDSALLAKYLSTELDNTRRRLVEIFIDRAKMERLPA